MITKITYIADDGKVFKDEYECRKYERQLRSNPYKDTALLFDDCGNPLPLTDESVQKASFIYCKDDDAANFMHEEFGRDWLLPWGNYHSVVCASAGCWIYDSERDEWISVNEVLKTAEIIQRIMKK